MYITVAPKMIFINFFLSNIWFGCVKETFQRDMFLLTQNIETVIKILVNVIHK